MIKSVKTSVLVVTMAELLQLAVCTIISADRPIAPEGDNDTLRTFTKLKVMHV